MPSNFPAHFARQYAPAQRLEFYAGWWRCLGKTAGGTVDRGNGRFWWQNLWRRKRAGLGHFLASGEFAVFGKCAQVLRPKQGKVSYS